MLTTAAVVGSAWALKSLTPERADPNMYMDSVYAAFKVAELNFVPQGTLVRFYGHKIGFDYPNAPTIARSAIEFAYGGTTSEYLHVLSPALYSLAMELRPTAEFPCTRLFFLIIWRGLYRLKQSCLAGNEKAAAAYLQSGAIRMIEQVLKGEELKAYDYGIQHVPAHQPLLNMSLRQWKMGDKKFSRVHEALLWATYCDMCGNGAKTALEPVKKELKAFVMTFIDPGPVYSSVHESDLTPMFEAQDFEAQMRSPIHESMSSGFWNWFEIAFHTNFELNNGKWLAQMGISRSAAWLGIGPTATTIPEPFPAPATTIPSHYPIPDLTAQQSSAPPFGLASTEDHQPPSWQAPFVSGQQLDTPFALETTVGSHQQHNSHFGSSVHSSSTSSSSSSAYPSSYSADPTYPYLPPLLSSSLPYVAYAELVKGPPFQSTTESNLYE